MAVAAGLVIANMLGVAAAEAPTGAPARTVSVEGVATVPIAQNANLAAATSVYRQGMAEALADGKSKAEFLASKAGATLGSVQSIVESGGSIGCTGGEEESGYAQYQGEQPDFGSPGASISSDRVVVPLEAAGTTKRLKKKKKTNSPSAKKSSATACTLSAAVSLVYAID